MSFNEEDEFQHKIKRRPHVRVGTLGDNAGHTPALAVALAQGMATGNFDNAFAAATEGGIERQCLKGQRDVVKTDKLPLNLDGKKALLESWGIQFLEQIDSIFQKVVLPEGWYKKSTGHSYYSDLIDDKGRVRASIFYKAAFYDTSASLSTRRRFQTKIYPEGVEDPNDSRHGDDSLRIRGVVFDGGNKIIFSTEPEERIHWKDHAGWSGQREKINAQTCAWLDEKYPDWKEENAYWDAE